MRFAFISLFLILIIQVFAQRKPLQNEEEWIEKINLETQKILNLQADFKQLKVLSFLEEPIIAKGQFWFKQKDKIRWEYISPYSYIIIMDNGVLKVKDNDDEYTTDLSSNKVFQQMNSLISGSIQGDLLNNTQDYSFEFYETDKYIIVRLNPLDEQLSAYLDYMEMSFDKDQLDMQILLMHEPSGDYTEMIFSNRQVNQNISDDVFK